MLALASRERASLEQGGCHRVLGERLHQALSSYAAPFPRCWRPAYRGQSGAPVSPSFFQLASNSGSWRSWIEAT
jgi:hypothetical protein